jgi:hypothetical protein
MKKFLFVLTFLLAISVSAKVSAYAADTADTVTLITNDNSKNFTMELKSNTLVVKNAPINKEIDGVIVLLEGEGTEGNVVSRLATCRGISIGCVIDISGLADGTYTISVNCRDVAYLGTAIGPVWSKIECDLDSDGVAEIYETIEYDESVGNYDNIYDFDEPIAVKDALYDDLNSDDYITGWGSFYYYNPVQLVIKNGKPSFETIDIYANNLKYTTQERTDATVLEYDKQLDKGVLSDEYLSYLDTTVKSIVSGITSDYEKAKAISNWVSENLWYVLPYPTGTVISSWNYFIPNTPFSETRDVVAGDADVCGGYAEFAVNLLRTAGFPAKVIHGDANGGDGWDGHGWVEVWVDNHWLVCDPTWDSNNYLKNGKFTPQTPCRGIYFDMSVATYSKDHKIDVEYMLQDDDEMLSNERTLVFFSTGHNVLKTVTDFTVGGLLPSTYGFKAEDL